MSSSLRCLAALSSDFRINSTNILTSGYASVQEKNAQRKISEFFTTCLTRLFWVLRESFEGSTKFVQAGYDIVGAVGARSAFSDLMRTITDDVAFAGPGSESDSDLAHWGR